MILLDAARRARETGQPQLLVEAIPFASYLGLTLELRGDELVCTLPADRRFLGNPVLDSLHGGATAGLLECAATLAMLWHKLRDVVPRSPVVWTLGSARSFCVSSYGAEIWAANAGVARTANETAARMRFMFRFLCKLKVDR